MLSTPERATLFGTGRRGRPWGVLFLGLAVAGAVAFAAGVSGPAAQRAWQAYLVNFVFWTGLSFGAVLFSAALTLTGARWAGPLRRLGEAFAGFLPIAFLLFCGLWFGRETLFAALGQAPPARRLWLAPGFLFPRDGAALALLAAVGLALVTRSVRGDRTGAGGSSEGDAGGLGRTAPARTSASSPPSVGKDTRCVRGFCVAGDEPPAPEPVTQGQGLAAAYGILYALVLTLLAIDWIMALDPHWTSTLFGAYYFVGAFYCGLAAVAVLAGLFGRELGLDGRQCQDLGTLVLAFAFTTGYLFYVQFLVIWYGNLPAETRFLILRLRALPWAPLTRVVLAAGFCVPVVVLLFRRAKARPAFLLGTGGLALAGMWLERFLLVAPSLSGTAAAEPLGATEALITAGYAGLVALSLRAFLGRFGPAAVPPLPSGDPPPARGQVPRALD